MVKTTWNARQNWFFLNWKGTTLWKQKHSLIWKGRKYFQMIAPLLSDTVCNHRIVFSETVKNCWKGPETCFSWSVKKIIPLHKIKDIVTEEPKEGGLIPTPVYVVGCRQLCQVNIPPGLNILHGIYLFSKNHSSDTGPHIKLKFSCMLSREKLCPQCKAYL